MSCNHKAATTPTTNQQPQQPQCSNGSNSSNSSISSSSSHNSGSNGSNESARAKVKTGASAMALNIISNGTKYQQQQQTASFNSISKTARHTLKVRSTHPFNSNA